MITYKSNLRIFILQIIPWNSNYLRGLPLFFLKLFIDYMKSYTFIPIITIPQLYLFGKMAGSSTFYKDFNLFKVNDNKAQKIIGPIEDGAPIIHVKIGEEMSILKSYNNENREALILPLKALIDTGASISVIRDSLVSDLELKQFAGPMVSGLNRQGQLCNVADATISITSLFPGDGYLDFCPAIVEFGSTYPFDFIIGYDILRYCIFNVDYPNNKYSLEFKEPIEVTPEKD